MELRGPKEDGPEMWARLKHPAMVISPNVTIDNVQVDDIDRVASVIALPENGLGNFINDPRLCRGLSTRPGDHLQRQFDHTQLVLLRNGE